MNFSTSDADALPMTWCPTELETLGHCPICQSTDRRLLYRNLTDTLFGSPGHWTLYACNKCCTTHLDPRPTAESIGKAYTQYPTHLEISGSTHVRGTQTRQSRLRTLVRATLNSYRNARWHMALSPNNSWGHYLVPLLPPIRSSIEQQMRHMPRGPADRQGQLLDVGCGNGAFLKLAQKAGWLVHGIDFDPIAVAKARAQGLGVYLGSIDQLAEQEQNYDWITCSHVLEHVHEPQKLLQSMYRLLRPGGVLWLQTPNINSIGHKVFRSNWRGIEPPRHLVLFTTQTLRQTLENIGFEIRFQKMGLFSAMTVYAASSALHLGDKQASALPHSRIFRLRFLLLAIAQSCSLRHAEFHTVIATR
jgi:2-polyprenyl-3-methyl-5-hydroxy-6-metoxy-1,4-benzoquinol methylase